jgi:atypical dual specificity phosphatase
MSPVLELQGFGLKIGAQVILRGVELAQAPRGVLALMGPGGAGKSSLLRFVCGALDQTPQLLTEGTARYLGAPLGDPRPALVVQHPRMMGSRALDFLFELHPQQGQLSRDQKRALAMRWLEQAESPMTAAALEQPMIERSNAERRLLLVLRGVLQGPALLCADEPSANLEERDALPILRLLRAFGRQAAVLCVTHHQDHARRFADEVALLAGGQVQEHAPRAAFFGAPKSYAAQQYVRTGGCDLPSPNATPDQLEESYAALLPPPAPTLGLGPGPRGMRWLRPGALAGCPGPGVLADVDEDLRALARAGIKRLVTLRTQPLNPAQVAQHGLAYVYFPIPDMGAPEPEACALLCAQLGASLGRQEPVAVHCKAGLGRTGTVLAAFLIWEGLSAPEAIQRARNVEARWIQSDAQLSFLESFYWYLQEQRNALS